MAIIFKYRQHPGHLLCERTLEDIPIEGPKGIDEDDPVNSEYNMKLTKFSFQVDRYRSLLFGLTLLFPLFVLLTLYLFTQSLYRGRHFYILQCTFAWFHILLSSF